MPTTTKPKRHIGKNVQSSETCVRNEIAGLGREFEEETQHDKDDAGVFRSVIEFFVGRLLFLILAEYVSVEDVSGTRGPRRRRRRRPRRR